MKAALSILFLATLVVPCFTAPAHGASSDAIRPFLDSDTFAVAAIDLAEFAKQRQTGDLNRLSLLPFLDPETVALLPGANLAEAFLTQLNAAGVETIYSAFGLQDLSGPVLPFELADGTTPDKVIGLLSPLAQSLGRKMEFRAQGNDRVLAGAKPTLDRYTQLKPTERDDLLEPLARLTGDGALVAGVLAPGPDFRRVVRELFPLLPGRLAPLTTHAADGWRRLEIAWNPAPETNPRIALEAATPEAAEAFAQLWRDVPSFRADLGAKPDEAQQFKAVATPIVEAIPAAVNESRVTLQLPTDAAKVAELRQTIDRAIMLSAAEHARTTRMDNFKQITLAMLNFESAQKHLPPPAIRDKDSKPLLSWRVAILPYMEHGDLYKQFHLDEPWDSPHNKTLIKLMPSVFADLDPSVKPLAGQGKTIYQVATARGTVFDSEQGTKYKEISDGTSNTALLFEVAPDRAVIWTKPDDWQADLANPRAGLEARGRNHITVGFADGHVEIVDLNRAGDDLLRAILTRAAGDEVQPVTQ